MWKVLPKLGLFKLIFAIFSALLVAILILIFENNINTNFSVNWNSYLEILEVATFVTIMFVIFIYIVGKVGWKYVWGIPLIGDLLNKNVCPNLNGVWIGDIESNYQIEGNNIKKEVQVEIKADFFGFSIWLKSVDGYQHSNVVQSEIYRDPRTNIFYISYIYEGSVPLPEESDDRVYDGAGKLEVKFENNIITLEGTYWTNRAWQRNLNTAGIIRLKMLS